QANPIAAAAEKPRTPKPHREPRQTFGRGEFLPAGSPAETMQRAASRHKDRQPAPTRSRESPAAELDQSHAQIRCGWQVETVLGAAKRNAAAAHRCTMPTRCAR